MKANEILRLYDEHERRNASFPNYRREEDGSVVRLVDLSGNHSLVSHSDLGPDDADAAIERELAYFKELGKPFEWKLFSHDEPADLSDRLAARGFSLGDEEAIMALDLSESPEGLGSAAGSDVRRVIDEAGFLDYAAVNEQAWPDSAHDGGWLAGVKATILGDPERMSAYVAYADGVPVCASRIEFPEHSPFASLWGGATLEPYRKRGIYTAMLSVRAREAAARGYRFLTIDASPMSRPIAAKHGFQLLCISRPCDSPR
ncbi:MAG: N-acetyltransferase [Spirochaetae bacterium HGW-Spirochaetae-3]|jgi:GNAT superfamily N-acetyltransferase|nr:MAG: N-acetyltransferase [Spirochaetae bacterium HGW-Spirochaetae-3]